MTGFGRLATLAAVSAMVALAQASVAEAQGRDRCNDYANQMISMDQRARQSRCNRWNSHSNYQHHYNWCQARPPQSAQTALSAWGTRFQACQFAASGSPAANASLNSCNRYANEMVQIDRRGRQQRCPGWNGHGRHNDHSNWCLQQTPERVQGALANWRARLRAC